MQHRFMLLSLVCSAIHAQSPPRPTSYELRGGQWFDGRAFHGATWYVSDGRFTARRPARVDSVLDLAGRFVIPPLGEAHNHNAGIRGDTAAARRYRDAGILYAMNPDNVPRLRDRQWGVDVAFTNGGFTGPGGHPEALVLRNLARGVGKPEDGRDVFYHPVRTRFDIDTAWTRFMADKPDAVKAYLLFSEEYAARLDDARYSGRRGMDPALLPYLVRKAHASGLRVWTHVETAHDLRVAVRAGVDVVAHLPGFRPDGPTLADYFPVERFRLSSADAARAARAGVTVVTTSSELLEMMSAPVPPGATADSMRAARQVVEGNLRLLRLAGVKLAVGSDRYRGSSLPEAIALQKTGIFTNAELLRMWTSVTDRTIFPARRIGRIAEGYEASFLVLAGNPAMDFSQVGHIVMRMVKGRVEAPPS
ncbi:MAG: hypothetical protein JWO05_3677 [Gemmatimonadetes bacterium]|nr:hypothetical protein [Gemmatimonadota bacterium]